MYSNKWLLVFKGRLFCYLTMYIECIKIPVRPDKWVTIYWLPFGVNPY